MKKVSIMLAVLVVMAFGAGVPVIALEVIPHPGHLSGSIVVGDQQLTDVTVRAIDIETGYSANVMVTVPEEVPSISYKLSVEGNRKYHVIAEARIIDTEHLSVIHPEQEFVYVPIYVNPEDEVRLDLFVEPNSVSESIPPEPVPATDTSEAEVLNPLEADSLMMGLSSTALALAPDFTINVFPSSQAVNPGETVTFLVSLTSLDGFNSGVTLSVSGLPEGVTASFNPDTVIPTGNSMLTISTDSEMATGTYPITIWGDGAGLARSADVNLTVDFGLIPIIYGTFSGRVTDIETGLPIAGAKVFVDNDSYAYLYHYRYANGSESRSGHHIEATTDPNGFYTLTGVSLGNNNTPKKILVGFYAEGYSLTFSNPTAVGEAIMPVDMELGHSTVTGIVTDASTGLPVEGATIYAYSYAYGSNGRAYSRLYATTDEDGVYFLPNMPLHLDNGPRTYSTFQVSAPGYPTQNQSVTVTEGSTLTVDFNLVPMLPMLYGAFTGQITDFETGAPIAGAKVFVDNDNYAYLYHYRYANGSESRSGHHIEATTDPNGFYTLTGVSLGNNNTPKEVLVGFYAEGYSLTFSNPTAVGDAIMPVDMALGHSSVTGWVADASTGLPIEGATIYTYSYAYGSNGRAYSRLYATTDVNGEYSLPNMPLHLDNGDRSYSPFQASAPGYYTQNKPITVFLGGTTIRDFGLVPMIFGTFSGWITEFKNEGIGEPIAGAKVFTSNSSYAYLYHYRYANGSEYPSGYNIEATTDSNGYYTLTGVPVGTNNTPKDVLVGFYAEGYSPTYTNATSIGGAITPDVNMALGYSGAYGWVADASTGLPIEGATIYALSYAYGSNGRARSQLYATTDEDGEYVLPNMPLHLDNGPRDYTTFQASAPGYYTQNIPITIQLQGSTRRDFAGPLYDTPVGTDVTVVVTDPNSEEEEPNQVSVTFSEVTEPGNTTVTFAETGPAVETGFKLGDPPTWFDITTTAVYEPNITVCLSYAGVVYQHEDQLKLMHFVDKGDPCAIGHGWEDVTILPIDTVNKIICGNVTSLSWIAIVEPAPIADAGPDQTVEQESCDGTEVALNGSSSTAPYSTPGTNDDIVSFDWYEADTFLASGETIYYTFPLGEHSVTLVVTDSCGLTDDDKVTIIVQDTTPPVVDAGSSIIVEQETTEGTEVTLNGSALDNCDAGLDYEWSENGVVLGNNATLTHTFSLGLHTLTLKAADNSGNVGTGTVTVTVVDDTTPPTITCPADVTLECPADTSTAATGSATATDNCDDSPVIVYSDLISGTCPMVIERTWTATDASGNSSSCTQVITVQDTIPPLITCPPDVILECPADTSVAANGSATASDACGSVTITHSDVWAPACGNTGTVTRTWTATDECGNSSTCVQTITVVDTTPPEVTVVIPQAGAALQDGVTLTAEASDISEVVEVYFYLREPGDTNGVPIGYEDLPGTLNTASGKWEYSFDTTQLLDGYYVILAKAIDTCGNEGWSEVVAFSIRNWAVIELLPASESNKAGRTMPVKFALRIAESVDPAMPFVYNEGLEIRIYDAAEPTNILQTSVYGDTSRDYRIDSAGELYITNFKTKRQPAEYVVEIWRTSKNFLVGSFTFETVK